MRQVTPSLTLCSSLVLILSACGGTGAPGGAQAADAVKLQGAGASFPAPLYNKWFKSYSAAHQNVLVGPTESASAAALAEAELPDSMRVYVPDPSGREAYPIVTLTWVLLYRAYPDARKHQTLHDLFRWCLTDGQRYAARLGYIPLPPGIVRRSMAALDEVRAAP